MKVHNFKKNIKFKCMKTIKFLLFAIMCLTIWDVKTIAQTDTNASTSKSSTDSINGRLLKPQKVITHGAVTVEGNKINYDAVAGTIVLKDTNYKPTCSMFYVAYLKSGVGDENQRPVTFIYNGGPGSSTIWLHMAAWGPRLAPLEDTARLRAPYKIVNNDYSLLDASDLVFIDAPGTGFSRVLTKDKGGAGELSDFYGIDQDAEAFSQFIINFLGAYNRWDSPKYLFGESYGTFRSAAVSYILETKDYVDLNGVILLSQILSYGNSADNPTENPGNDMAYILALPSYASTAWYHNKLPNRPQNLEPFLKEVEDFAMNEYTVALVKGSSLDTSTFNQIAEKLHQYTGLPVAHIKKTNLRITDYDFEKTLLGNDDRVTGRLDTRFSGFSMDPLGEFPLYDPQDATVGSAITATFNNYVRSTLNFDERMDYKVEPADIYTNWDNRHLAVQQAFGATNDRIFANVMPDLALAMIHNPKLRVMLNMGYFDLATPYFEGIYEMHHLPMPNALQKNISYAFYKSGHMVYLHPQSHKKLHDNVAKFIEDTH
jgi:carboxypeptidase C (cathepsin A)